MVLYQFIIINYLCGSHLLNPLNPWSLFNSSFIVFRVFLVRHPTPSPSPARGGEGRRRVCLSELFAVGRVLAAFFRCCGTLVHRRREMGLNRMGAENQVVGKGRFGEGR